MCRERLNKAAYIARTNSECQSTLEEGLAILNPRSNCTRSVQVWIGTLQALSGLINVAWVYGAPGASQENALLLNALLIVVQAFNGALILKDFDLSHKD